jgi:hypothetical protein
MHRLIDSILAIAFLLLAALQLNDPDPLFWVALYGLCALPPLLALINRSRDALFWMAVGFCVAGLALTLTGGVEYLDHMREDSLLHSMTDNKPYIEEAREVLGTLIALALLTAHRLNRRSRA